MKGIIENVELWWRHNGRYFHKDFISGIKNLFKWFPTIWRDRDWDSTFIFNILIKKLEFQAKYIGTNNRHTRAKRDSEIMMTCVRLMEKIREEEYAIEYMDYHDTKFEFVDCDIPGHKQLKTTELSENFNDYFKKYPRLHKKISSENPNEPKNRIAFLMAIENHKKAKKTLFKLMENYIEHWWD
jgi:hypothetical protein